MGNLPFSWGQHSERGANTEFDLESAWVQDERWPLYMLSLKDEPASD